MGPSEDISDWIKQQVGAAGAKGVVVGLSGGVDSSVVGALAKKALGGNVLGLILPCYSKEEDENHANLVARKLNINTKKIILDSIYDNFTEVLPMGNRMALANLKVRLRMSTLYYFANSLNYLVVGTGNKSEIMAGYSTKYGDAGADILPLGGLLKTEVKELARELDIPDEILNKAPSAGLWENQTDEDELGISYEDLDKALTALERGENIQLQQELVDKVKELIKKSEHKRILPPIFKPIKKWFGPHKIWKEV